MSSKKALKSRVLELNTSYALCLRELTITVNANLTLAEELMSDKFCQVSPNFENDIFPVRRY